MIKKPFFFKIQTRLICFFIILITTLILLLSFISYQFTLQNNKKISITYVSDILSEISSRIDDYIEGTKNLSGIIVNNTDVLEVMSLYTDDKIPRQDIILQTREHLHLISNTRQEIVNIAILSLNGDIIFEDNQNIFNPNSNYRVSDWFLKPLTLINETIISPPHIQDLVENEGKMVISISKAIIDKQNDRVVGVMVIDLNYEKIEEICKDIQQEQSSYLYIIDRIGNIIYHPQQDLIFSGKKTEKIHDILRSEQDIITFDNLDYLKLNSLITDWTTVGVINTDTLVKNKSFLLTFYFYLSIVSILIITVAIIIFAKSILHPIVQLEKFMKKAEFDLDVRSNVKVNNEIGKLSDTYNTMLDKLQLLMAYNTQKEEEKRNLEIKALQAQINPHFLYNTLETIIWLSTDNKNDDVVEVTSALAGLFRSSINKNDGLVTLKMEKQNIESYLTIQQIRYKNKLNFSIDIPNELCSFKVPSLIIQPIVENSLYHGLKPSENGGDIFVSAVKVDDTLKIIIKDTGLGMTKEKLESIFDFDETKDNIGILNVHNRIRLTFGESYGLIYESVENKGTTVTMTFPVVYQYS